MLINKLLELNQVFIHLFVAVSLKLYTNTIYAFINYIFNMYKLYLALNNLQLLICSKNQINQTNIDKFYQYFLYVFCISYVINVSISVNELILSFLPSILY